MLDLREPFLRVGLQARDFGCSSLFYTSCDVFDIALTLKSDMDPAERIEAASKFLLQSPPGEINDVLNGVPPFLLH